jgi:hypothetical protein
MRKTVNPYFNSLKLMWDRMTWDLSRESWASRRKLKYVKDRYSGGKAVILCNGPSLNDVDFEKLSVSGVYTFGLNKINLLFDRTEFRPSAVVAINEFVIEQNAPFYKDTDIPLYLSWLGLGDVGRKEHVTYLHTTRQQKFAQDCSVSVVPGYTVTYVALQLAFHMGFKQVALVGCDHNFASKGRPNQTVEAEATDPNHFDPRYFSGGVKWQLPDLIGSEYFYNLARQSYDLADRQIFNCTEGGKLDLFERRLMSDFLRK